MAYPGWIYGASVMVGEGRELLADDKTMEREFGNLLKIQDNYPKYVISMNPMSRSQNYEGIKHLTLRQFLMLDNL